MQRLWNLSKLVTNTLADLILVIFSTLEPNPLPLLSPPPLSTSPLPLLSPPLLPTHTHTHTHTHRHTHTHPTPLSAGKKIDLQKTLFRRNEQFPSELGMMIKTWGRVLLVGMSKNEQIQFFDLQMYLPVILALSIWNFSTTMVWGNTAVYEKNQERFWRDKSLRSP